MERLYRDESSHAFRTEVFYTQELETPVPFVMSENGRAHWSTDVLGGELPEQAEVVSLDATVTTALRNRRGDFGSEEKLVAFDTQPPDLQDDFVCYSVRMNLRDTRQLLEDALFAVTTYCPDNYVNPAVAWRAAQLLALPENKELSVEHVCEALGAAAHAGDDRAVQRTVERVGQENYELIMGQPIPDIVIEEIDKMGLVYGLSGQEVRDVFEPETDKQLLQRIDLQPGTRRLMRDAAVKPERRLGIRSSVEGFFNSLMSF